jgi:DNA-binding protein HU-beta
LDKSTSKVHPIFNHTQLGLSNEQIMKLRLHQFAKSDKVTLVGFGSFDVRKSAARKGRNPQTGKEINIAARKAPAFKAGKALKEAVGKK